MLSRTRALSHLKGFRGLAVPSSADSGRPFAYEDLGSSKARMACLHGELITSEATDYTTQLVRSDGSLEDVLTGMRFILGNPIGGT